MVLHQAMFARILFYPSLGYTALMARYSSRNWYDRVDDTVIIGALPTKSIAEQLVKEENIKAVLSVNEDYELKHISPSAQEWADYGVEQLQLSTVDFTGSPSLQQLIAGVDFILSHHDRSHSVYVHCKAGRTRSATLVVCYLMQAAGLTPEKSFELLKSHRPHVWLRDKQWASVRHFYKHITTPSSPIA